MPARPTGPIQSLSIAYLTKKPMARTRIAIPILLIRFSPMNFSQSVGSAGAFGDAFGGAFGDAFPGTCFWGWGGGGGGWGGGGDTGAGRGVGRNGSVSLGIIRGGV